MWNALVTFLSMVKDAFAYRIRGGGFFQFGGDTPCRLLWGVSLALSYFVLHYAAPDYVFCGLLPFLGFATMMIPHGYAMNMGRWHIPQKKYPSFWLPTLETSEWVALPMFWRTAYDFASMASIAAFRAAIVFAPYVALRYFVGGELEYIGALRGSAILIVGQPLSYLVSWYVPFTFTSLEARSAEWAEFFNGAVWTLAVAQL